MENDAILKTAFMHAILLSYHQHLLSQANQLLTNLAELEDKLSVLTQDSKVHQTAPSSTD